jgi:hypothetical protein
MVRRAQPVTAEEQAERTRQGRFRAKEKRADQRFGFRDRHFECPECGRVMRVAQRDIDGRRTVDDPSCPGGRTHYECSRGHRVTRTSREMKAKVEAASRTGVDRIVL